MSKVLQVAAAETYDWLLSAHYAHRIPPISFAFGLFVDGVPIGYVTYGVPSSSPLREGIAGAEYASCVLELNRLVFCGAHDRNAPSQLVSGSLRMLPRPSIVVSYADTAQGHVGYVYQACNFIYTGLSAKRTNWTLDGHGGLHGQTIADMSREASGGPRGSRAAYMRDKYGDAFHLEPRSRKHRYIFVTGSARGKRTIEAAIKYAVEPYPKGDSTRYAIDRQPITQTMMF